MYHDAQGREHEDLEMQNMRERSPEEKILEAESAASIGLRQAFRNLNTLYHAADGQPGFEDLALTYKLVEVAEHLLTSGLKKQREYRKSLPPLPGGGRK